MYMVGHDHIFPYPGDIPEVFFHHPANGGKGELRADVGIGYMNGDIATGNVLIQIRCALQHPYEGRRKWL